MAPPAKPASPAQVSELGKIVFKIFDPPAQPGSERGKIVFKLLQLLRGFAGICTDAALPLSLAASVLSRVCHRFENENGHIET